MANGDPIRLGLNQPPDNRADSATVVVQNGSAFGTQNSAFWVQRVGAPVCNAVIRGDNFSTGRDPGGMHAGVLGTTPATSGGAGVVGTSTGGRPNVFYGESGVLGVATGSGVVGKSLSGVVIDEAGVFVSGTGVVGECPDGVGVHGVSQTGRGVIGRSVERAGVTGTSDRGVGVEARSNQSHGLLAATQNGVGVLARSAAGNGVLGRSSTAVGVEGVSDDGPAGVHGVSARRYGVFGESDQGVGVIGTSQTNAIQGWSTGTGGASVGVTGHSAGGTGVSGHSVTGIGVNGSSQRGWAGYFNGNVMVQGAFYVLGGTKAASVPHPDGTLRSLFCVESTESYFEDFGEVALSGDATKVSLDRDFAALVKCRNYQVFLTTYGPDAVYVRRRTATSFEIARVSPSPKSRNIRVGYRIVARRADVRSARLPVVEMPPTVTRPPVPEAARPGSARKTRKSVKVELEPLPSAPKTPAIRSVE